ncbi:hypothetical protein EV126DRAFT_431728 [Verticillium dahliae]|nr:hypothetical protein EV126DRAFT_431728 [Verticillium dahliae]
MGKSKMDEAAAARIRKARGEQVSNPKQCQPPARHGAKGAEVSENLPLTDCVGGRTNSQDEQPWRRGRTRTTAPGVKQSSEVAAGRVVPVSPAVEASGNDKTARDDRRDVTQSARTGTRGSGSESQEAGSSSTLSAPVCQGQAGYHVERNTALQPWQNGQVQRAHQARRPGCIRVRKGRTVMRKWNEGTKSESLCSRGDRNTMPIAHSDPCSPPQPTLLGQLRHLPGRSYGHSFPLPL